MTSASNGDDQHRGDGREEDDAVGEREPVAAGVQLARQEAVAGQDRAEHREAVEGGVGGEHEDEPGDGGDAVEAEREAAEDRLGELADDRVLHVVVADRRAVAQQLRRRVLGELTPVQVGERDDR